VADLLFVAIAVAFFAVAALYVTACDRLVGRERFDGAIEGDAERTGS